MDLNKEILSNIVIFEKYSKFIEEKKRRETFNEIAYRNRDMHLKKYSSLPPEMILLINKVYGPALRYADHNEVVGLLNCVQQEFYRRFTAPYEDLKIEEQGDLQDL